MAYNPSIETATLLQSAWTYVQAVPYQVTARWVFYRLLQDGSLTTKSDYKRLLSYLSKARKEFYRGWRPDTLTDDSRAALVNGSGFEDGQAWLDAVARQTVCSLDRWETQPVYVEFWFEAAAMQAQFSYHANENVSLLAFHGDISIPEKWKAAERLAHRWIENPSPIKIMYFGDLDEKGLMIPETARADVLRMIGQSMWYDMRVGDRDQTAFLARFDAFLDDFEFTRVGINDEHVQQYGIPDNPERPGTYQWEGLDDAAAEELIGIGNALVDVDAFAAIGRHEDAITMRFRDHLEGLTFEGYYDDDAT